MIYLLLNFFLSFVIGNMADNRGRSFVGWTFFSFFFSFLFGLILVCALGQTQKKKDEIKQKDYERLINMLNGGNFITTQKKEETPVKNYMITGNVNYPKLIEILKRYAGGKYWKITNPNTFEYKQSDPDSNYVFPDLDDSQNRQMKEFLQDIRLGNKEPEDLLKLVNLLTQDLNFNEAITQCTQQS